MKYTVFLMGLIMLVLTSCGTVSVKSDYDREANFSNYKTFQFYEKGLNDLKMNDLDKRRVVRAIVSELNQKGMTMTEGEPSDLIINISAKNRTKVDVNQWYNPWWGFGPFWGGGANNVRQYKQGTLIIDMVDAKTNTLVWQGVGDGLNVSDLDKKEEKVPMAVKEILAKYPPKK